MLRSNIHVLLLFDCLFPMDKRTLRSKIQEARMYENCWDPLKVTWKSPFTRTSLQSFRQILFE